MSAPWSFLTRRFGGPDEAAAPPLLALPDLTVPRLRESEEPAGQRRSILLDSIGQRDEMLRVRMSEMTSRLDDAKSLSEDFAQLLEPIERISAELPLAKARVLELEALHAQELEQNLQLRREVDLLSERVSGLAGEAENSEVRAARLEAAHRDRETAIEELRLSLREKTLMASELERQTRADRERLDGLETELAALRSAGQAAERALIDSERKLEDASDARAFAEQEVRRLQNTAEELNGRSVALQARVRELEQALDESSGSVAAFEIQLAGEQAAHQRTQAQAEADLTSARTERASLLMKLESATARQGATEQILSQVRSQLREKEEALRLSERSAKEALSDRAVADRRLEGLREELERRNLQLQEGQRERGDLEDRCEMLGKALAAKDGALENATAKTQTLSARAESLTLRFEKERQALEASNRRLVEELQNERAERTLAQGALDIARESRLSLQRQNEALKRAARVRKGEPAGDPSARGEGEVTRNGASNVAIFPPLGEKRGDDGA